MGMKSGDFHACCQFICISHSSQRRDLRSKHGRVRWVEVVTVGHMECHPDCVRNVHPRSLRCPQDDLDVGDLMMICGGDLTATFPPISDLTIDMPDPKRSAARCGRETCYSLKNAGKGVAADQ